MTGHQTTSKYMDFLTNFRYSSRFYILLTAIFCEIPVPLPHDLEYLYVHFSDPRKNFQSLKPGIAAKFVRLCDPLSRNPAQINSCRRDNPLRENLLGFLGRRNPQLRRIARGWVFLSFGLQIRLARQSATTFFLAPSEFLGLLRDDVHINRRGLPQEPVDHRQI